MSKILGVIGGMGNFAANYFIKRVMQITPAEKEWEYFRMIVDYNVFIPSRTRALLYGEDSPASEMIKTIGNLQLAGADVIAVPCNSAHGWYDEISKYASIKPLNLIEVTSDAVKNQNIDNVLVIGAYVTVEKKLYDKYIDNTFYLKKHEYRELFRLIERLKLDENKKMVKKKLYNLIKSYKDSVDGVLIACTEPSMLFDVNESCWNGFKIVDSTNEYAKRCVELCMKDD